jgi:hypothetical protein
VVIEVNDKTAHKTWPVCPKCNKPLIGTADEEPYCLMHGTPRSDPNSEMKVSRKSQLTVKADIESGIKSMEAAVASAGQTGATKSQDKPAAANKPAAGPDQTPSAPPAAGGPPADPEEIPAKPDVQNPYTMNRYYEANKDRIIQYYAEFGSVLTAGRWKIQNSQVCKLMKRWGVKPPGHIPQSARRETRHKSKPGPLSPVPQVVSQRALPELPAYNPEWPLETQKLWLEIYRELAVGVTHE